MPLDRFDPTVDHSEDGAPDGHLGDPPRERDALLAGLRSQLREGDDLFERFMASCPAAACIKDEQGRFLWVNAHLERLCDRPLADWIGRTVADLFPAEEAAKVRANDRTVLAGGGATSFVEAMTCAGRHERHLAYKFRMEGSQGGPLLAGISVDITEQVDAQNEVRRLDAQVGRLLEQLRDAERRKNDLLAALAHELRNPLAPIRNAVQLLKVKSAPDPTIVWSRDVIDRQVQHMARLLEDLLDVSRISREKLELRRVRVDLESIIEMAVETSRPVVDAGRHELTVSIPGGPMIVFGDPVRLAQVFSNLLNNAAKYTPEGGEITVAVERRGAACAVTVKDDGIGISQDMLPKVFDIFAQAETALASAQGGLGLGLSLVKGLVELHGGKVVARSDGPDRGSEFTVELPLVESAPAGSQEGTGPGAAPKHRVLIVDDNVDSADSLTVLLTVQGFEARAAYDGEQALLVAAELRPTVVLLDIGMPRMNGLEVCRRLREQPWVSGLFVVAMTGWGQAEDRQKTRDAGFDHHLVKPIDSDTLKKLLAECPTPSAA